MKRMTAYILTGLLLVLIIEIVIVVPTEVKEPLDDTPMPNAEVASQFGKNDEIEQRMESVHVIETRDQMKEWELWADRAVGLRDSAKLTLSVVRADFFTPSGLTFNVTGEEGAVFPNNKNMEVNGNVVTKSSNGYTFRTESVRYSSQNRFLQSPTPVEVLGPREPGTRPLYIKGQKMEANLVEGIMLIQQSVRAERTVNNNRSMVVEADSAQLSGHDKAVKFSGNVVIDLDGVKITGPDALLRYDSAADILKSIELAGGVQVKDINKSATSNQLKINLADNKFIFDGNPRIIQDEDEVSGDRIIFLDGGKKVKIENARVRVRGQSLEKMKSEDKNGTKKKTK